MIRSIIRIVAVSVILCATTRGASAQSRFPPSSETPTAEIAVFGGAWNLEPSGPIGLGGRVSVNRSEWFGTELSLEMRHGDAYGPPHGMLIMNGRAIATDPERRAIGVFTAGAAIGVGFHRTVSPMLGVGLQTLWIGGIVAARGDLQYFPGGAFHDHSNVRLTFGIVVAVR